MHSGEVLQSPIVWHPLDAAEAYRLKQTLGKSSVYISGGTLLRTQWEAGIAPIPQHLINLSNISGTAGVYVANEQLVIGALTSLSTIRYDNLIAQYCPNITDAVRQIAAPSIRNQATIGGNILSTVGDALPALLIYEAVLVWHDGVETEMVKLENWLHHPQKYRSDANRVLLQIQIPALSDHPDQSTIKRFDAYHKVGRREAFTPSVATIAITGRINEAGLLSSFRIAAGGGQTIAHRLHETEALLEGKKADQELLARLYESIWSEYEPVEDVFASTAYRKQTAANLIVAEIWKRANDFRKGVTAHAAR